METVKQRAQKFAAFSAVVLLGAAFPHYWWGQTVPVHPRHATGGVSPEDLLPLSIGEFHVVDRWTFPQKGDPAEIGAIYQDAAGKHLAQIAIHMGPHDGASCYIARGIPLQRQFEEQVAAADSVADFNISLLGDESMAGLGQRSLLMATSACTATGCAAAPRQRNDGLRIVFPKLAPGSDEFSDPRTLSLSIVLQSHEHSADGRDEQHAAEQFRALMTNFRLLPLRNFYVSH
jgi:hypothetical protein